MVGGQRRWWSETTNTQSRRRSRIRLAAGGNPGVPPSAKILDSTGRDITSQISAARSGALLDTHNEVLASLLGDASSPAA